MKTRFEQNIERVKLWRDIVGHYWHEYQGQLHNQQAFWRDTIHSMQPEDWWAWVDCHEALRIEHEELWRRFPKLKEDTEDIKRRLMLGKSLSRPGGVGQNLVVFRALMAIHDLINLIDGTPTEQFTDKGKDQDDPTAFERLFD